MNKAYLLTGGNLGNRRENLLKARQLIKQYCGKIVQQSSVYQTADWGIEDQPDFFNEALYINTILLPDQLMQTLLMIEEKMGRKRDLKMGPRIIDIDILLFNDDIINMPHLSIPHPRLHERKFALIPLVEIAADIVHPVMHKTMQRLLEECRDKLNVHKLIEVTDGDF